MVDPSFMKRLRDLAEAVKPYRDKLSTETPPDTLSETQEIQIKLETLEFVYEEVKKGFEDLSKALEEQAQRGDRTLQLSLVVISIVVAILSTTSRDRLQLQGAAVVLMLGAIVALVLSAGLVMYINLPGFLRLRALRAWVKSFLTGMPMQELNEGFYTGTIFPQILMGRLDEPEEEVMYDIIDVVARSYNNNYTLLSIKLRIIGMAQVLQFLGVVCLFIALLIEVLHREL